MNKMARRGILGAITGVVVALSMDLLTGWGYLAGANILVRAVVAGAMAYVVITGLFKLTGEDKGVAAEKK